MVMSNHLLESRTSPAAPADLESVVQPDTEASLQHPQVPVTKTTSVTCLCIRMAYGCHIVYINL